MGNELRIGVFGAWRGRTYMKALKYIEGARVTAVCEKKGSRIEKAKADGKKELEGAYALSEIKCNKISETAEKKRSEVIKNAVNYLID